MLRFLARLRSCRKGATAVEYGLIISLIVISMLAGFIAMSDATVGLWGTVGNKVAAAR